IRTRKEALSGGMPLAKYLANRTLTLIENMLSGQNLGEWPSGFRAYRRDVLVSVPFELNRDDFVFDSQFLVQAVHLGFKVGAIPAPVCYFDAASSIHIPAAAKDALLTLWMFGLWYLHRFGLTRAPLLLAKSDEGRKAARR